MSDARDPLHGLRILGVILARGGSKGIPRKNIRPLAGHPLIAYSIAAGLESGCLTRFVVSTDDPEIAAMAVAYGATAPFLRPAHLAEDHVWSRDALQHAVLETERIYGETYDLVIELPATAPLRGPMDVRGALEKLVTTGADSVVGVVQVLDKHPVRMKRIVDDQLRDFTTEFPEGESSRRQDLEPCYARNGSIYAMTRATIVDHFSRVGAISRPYVMPDARSVNLDEMTDFYLAEAMIDRGLCVNRPRRVDADALVERAPNRGKPRLLMSAPFAFMPEVKREIAERFDATFAFGAGRAVTRTLLADAEIWITATCPTYRIDADLLDAAPRLRILATPSTGTTHIDMEAVRARNLRVLTLKDSPVIGDIHASSEFSFALLLALIKRLPKGLAFARRAIWRAQEDLLRSRELDGMVLGLIGYGRIGRNMSRYAAPFGMRVLAHDPFVDPESAEPDVRFVSRDELLAASDVVSLHVHYGPETAGMFGAAEFAAMRPGAYFLNTARGELVDEAALLDALRSGKLAGAAADVISGENADDLSTHPLIRYARDHETLLVTPHIAGLTVDSETKAAREILRQIQAAL